jgi:hypothetical protein
MRTMRLVLVIAFLWSMAPSGRAQQQQAPGLPSARLLTVSPLGGKAGSTIEVTVSGQDLEEPQQLLFSHPGIKSELLAAPKPAPMETAKPAPKPKPAPPVVTTRFKVTIPADTPLGSHDVRIVNKWGVSNPRAFIVGDQNEELEKEPNNDVPEAQRVDINTTISGVIGAPTDVDYFVFAGKKGQRVVASCRTSSIDSRLPAGLQLFASGGALLGFNRQYDGNDALLDVTLPSDGDYYLRLFTFTYTQGGPEFFYRLSITTAPWIDAVFPPMIEPGKPAEVTVYGRNLPGGQPDPNAAMDGQVLEKVKIKVTPPTDPIALQRLDYPAHVQPNASALDGFSLQLKGPAGTSNPFLISYAQAPVVLDNGANDTADTAQEATLPCEIAGRIEKRGDRDWYVFTARKGEVYSVEAIGDRLGATLDLYFSLRRADGKQAIGEFDDNTETLHPTQFFTRTDDPPRYRFAVPEDGRYHLMLSSREATLQAGPRHLYRLRITPERPDFRIVAMPPMPNVPDACVVHQGGRTYCNVYVWRLDGYNGPITLTAEGLPEGVTCPPQTIGAGVRQAGLVLTAADDAPSWTGTIAIKGTATISDQEVVREARSASITWPAQQNQVTLSRLDRSLVLAVRDKAPYTLTAGVESVTAKLGEKVNVPLKISRLWPDAKGPLQVIALGLPPNVQVTTGNQPINLPAGKDEATLPIDVRTNAAPGTYTIILRSQMVLPFSKDPMAKQKPNATAVQPSSPIMLTIVPK